MAILLCKRELIGISVLFLLIYIVPLNVRPAATPDETRYGEIAREMLVTRDLIVPRLNGLRYFEKPVFGYWLTALSMALFGDNVFAIRLPSVFAVGLTATTIFLLVYRFYGCNKAALLSAFIYITFMEVYGVGTFCVLDSLLTFLLASAMGCFFIASVEKSVRNRNVWLLLCGALSGTAFLTKGFLAFALIALTVIPYMLWEKRGKDLFTLLRLPIFSIFAVALPWCLMIAIREPDFWSYFFWNEHVQRYLSADSSMHGRPFWFLIPAFIGGAFPWIVFFPFSIVQYKRELLRKPLVRFCICWIMFSLIFFSASSGKLITYVLPCFPPMAMLMGIGLTEYLKNGTKHTLIYYDFLWFLTAGLVVLSLLLITFIPSLHQHIYGSGEIYKTWYCLCAAILCFIIMFLPVLIRDRLWKTFTQGFSVAVIMLVFPFTAPVENSVHAGMTTFLRTQQDYLTKDTILISDYRTVQAVCYVYRRTDVYLFMRNSELRYGLSYPDSSSRFIKEEGLKKLLRDRGDLHIAVIIKKTTRSRAKMSWPDPVCQTSWKDFWFAIY